MKLFLILGVVFTIYPIWGCSKQNENKPLYFISMALPNRPGNIPHAHDQNCQGFLKNDFNVKTLINLNPDSELTKQLEMKTGLVWTPVSKMDSILDFTRLIKPDTNSVIYFLEVIKSDRGDTVILSLGSDDGITVWVNGDTVLNSHKGRRVLPFDDVLKVKLKVGVNTLLYKIDQTTGGWGLYRKWLSKEKLNQEISSRIPDLYADLPESCILPDSAQFLKFKTDSRKESDTFHNLHIKWYRNGNLLSESVYKPAGASHHIKLPDLFRGFALASISVYDLAGNRLFEETIPIANESFIRTTLKHIKKKSIKDFNSDYQARQMGIDRVFFSDLKDKSISTRMKVSLVYDLMETENKNIGSEIIGYYSEHYKKNEPVRIFIPSGKPEKAVPLVFIMTGVKDPSSDLFSSYEGGSHALMSSRITQAEIQKLVMVMRQIKGEQSELGDSKTELPFLYNTLSTQYDIDSSSIGAIAWSKDCFSLLELLGSKVIPLKSIALISAVLPDNETELTRLLLNIRDTYPGLSLFVRHGLDDTDAPVFVIRKFVQIAEKLGFQIDYSEVPYSSHWSYLVDPEKEYYTSIGKK
ncbi:MAG: hypothetical protein J0L62_16150 [Bacteroidetes bacterium]|nr:hypothetical protein [Bacteroidota bacterium]